MFSSRRPTDWQTVSTTRLPEWGEVSCWVSGLAIHRDVDRDNRLSVDRAYADKLPFLLND